MRRGGLLRICRTLNPAQPARKDQVDSTDIDRAIAALIAVGALPDDDGMVH